MPPDRDERAALAGRRAGECKRQPCVRGLSGLYQDPLHSQFDRQAAGREVAAGRPRRPNRRPPWRRPVLPVRTRRNARQKRQVKAAGKSRTTPTRGLVRAGAIWGKRRRMPPATFECQPITFQPPAMFHFAHWPNFSGGWPIAAGFASRARSQPPPRPPRAASNTGYERQRRRPPRQASPWPLPPILGGRLGPIDREINQTL